LSLAQKWFACSGCLSYASPGGVLPTENEILYPGGNPRYGSTRAIPPLPQLVNQAERQGTREGVPFLGSKPWMLFSEYKMYKLIYIYMRGV